MTETNGARYAFKVKKVPGGSYYFVSLVLLAITFVPVYFGSLALLGMPPPWEAQEAAYSGGFLASAAAVAHLLIVFCGSMAFIEWLLHAWVSIDLRDDRFEITRKRKKRVIHFREIRDMVKSSKYSFAHEQDRVRTPTIYIALEKETYQIRQQHYFVFGTSKQFNAFYNDFKSRLNVFAGGEPLEEEEVRKFTTWADEWQALKRLFTAEATEERKERERKEEERRERIRSAYAKGENHGKEAF